MRIDTAVTASLAADYLPDFMFISFDPDTPGVTQVIRGEAAVMIIERNQVFVLRMVRADFTTSWHVVENVDLQAAIQVAVQLLLTCSDEIPPGLGNSQLDCVLALAERRI